MKLETQISAWYTVVQFVSRVYSDLQLTWSPSLGVRKDLEGFRGSLKCHDTLGLLRDTKMSLRILAMRMRAFRAFLDGVLGLG